MSSRYQQFDDFMRQYLSTRDKSHLRSAFRLLDLDGDGYISKAEMLTFYRDLGSERDGARERMMAIFKVGDVNKDGVLDEREFEKVARKVKPIREKKPGQPQVPDSREAEVQRLLAVYSETNDPAVLESVFKLLDTDNSGVLTQAELQASFLLREASDKPTAANMLLTVGDLDQDGVIDLEEFVQLVHN